MPSAEALRRVVEVSDIARIEQVGVDVAHVPEDLATGSVWLAQASPRIRRSTCRSTRCGYNAGRCRSSAQQPPSISKAGMRNSDAGVPPNCKTCRSLAFTLNDFHSAIACPKTHAVSKCNFLGSCVRTLPLRRWSFTSQDPIAKLQTDPNWRHREFPVDVRSALKTRYRLQTARECFRWRGPDMFSVAVLDAGAADCLHRCCGESPCGSVILGTIDA